MDHHLKPSASHDDSKRPVPSLSPLRRTPADLLRLSFPAPPSKRPRRHHAPDAHASHDTPLHFGATHWPIRDRIARAFNHVPGGLVQACRSGDVSETPTRLKKVAFARLKKTAVLDVHDREMGDADALPVPHVLHLDTGAQFGTPWAMGAESDEDITVWDTDENEVNIEATLGVRRRTKIVEIAACGDLIIALDRHGLCAVFERSTQRRICYLNLSVDEVIRSMFLNHANQNLVLVSVFKEDDYTALRVKSIPLRWINANWRTEQRFQELFLSESLRHPGFVEFDDVNNKVLTLDGVSKTYRIWDLTNYEFLYDVPASRGAIDEVKTGVGLLLVIYRRDAGALLQMDVRDIHSGQLIKAMNRPLHRHRQVSFVEYCAETLLLKQESHNLRLIDMSDKLEATESIEVPGTADLQSHAFTVMHERKLVSVVRSGMISIWDLRGFHVASLEDHRLLSDSLAGSFITSRHDLIVSFCVVEGDHAGSVNVSELESGKLIAKFQRSRSGTLALEYGDPEDTSAVFYNETLHEIYEGLESGTIVIWS